MIHVKSTYNGAEAYATVVAMSWEAIQRMVVYYHMKLQEAVGISAGPKRVNRQRGKGSYTIYTNPSKPGEPPRKRTGYGQKNILYDFDKPNLSARVGVTRNAHYMAILDLFRNRPWLLSTLRRILPQLKALAKTP